MLRKNAVKWREKLKHYGWNDYYDWYLFWEMSTVVKLQADVPTNLISELYVCNYFLKCC